MEEELHALVTGRVQGVGFRHATAWKARELGLTGWVRNLGSGQVESVLQGDRPTIELMVQWLHQGPTFARVQGVETRWKPNHNMHHSFDVR